MHVPSMCKVLKASQPPMPLLRVIIRTKGYSVSQSHTEPLALKSNAPVALLWDAVIAWLDLKSNCKASSGRLGETAAGTVLWKNRSGDARLVSKEDVLDAELRVKRGEGAPGDAATGKGKQCRFPENPAPNWGPRARAGVKRPAPSDEAAPAVEHDAEGCEDNEGDGKDAETME
mmetsp:Transcript_24734/g.61835  ORF Transcript_24734/g.61835 Transcript_24734/m.61835 type:complete len:174 (-) Transcript_24734:293-814(-)